jgi:hypothetical protein
MALLLEATGKWTITVTIITVLVSETLLRMPEQATLWSAATMAMRSGPTTSTDSTKLPMGTSARLLITMTKQAQPMVWAQLIGTQLTKLFTTTTGPTTKPSASSAKAKTTTTGSLQAMKSTCSSLTLRTVSTLTTPLLLSLAPLKSLSAA